MVWLGVDLKNGTIKACVHQRLDYVLKSYELISTPDACYKLYTPHTCWCGLPVNGEYQHWLQPVALIG